MRKHGSLKLEGIIFDVDGTLADTEDAHRQAFNQTFDEFDLDWYWSIERYVELLAISGGKERIAIFGKELRKRFSSDSLFFEFIAELHERKGENYRNLLSEKGVKLRPGVKRLIQEGIQNLISLNIATSSSFANVDALMSANFGTNWEKYFQVIETCDTTKEKKPNPAVYKNVLSKSKLKAENVIAIEDTPNGLEAALRASIKTVVTVHRMTAENFFHNSSLVLDSMGEPEQPFNVLSGNAFDHRFLNLLLLDKLLGHPK